MQIIKELKTKTNVSHDFKIERVGISYLNKEVESVTLKRAGGGETVRFNKSDIEMLEQAIKGLKGAY